MYFKNYHRNIEKMIQLACIAYDYKKEHYSRYIKESKIKLLLVASFWILSILTIFFNEYGIFYIGVIFLSLLLITIPVVKMLIYSIIKIKKISKSDNPLMCFESNIVEIVEKKYRSSNGGFNYIRYILLDEDIELRISAYDYYKIKNKNAKKVKIYFHEELLREIKIFDLETVE